MVTFYNRFLRIAAAFLLLGAAVSCTSETALGLDYEDGGGEGAVRFSIGVPSGPVTKAVGDELAAEDDEKSVNNLYAVLFRDADTSGSGADKGQEDDGDVFFRMFDVLNEGEQYTEEISGEDGETVTTTSTDTYILPVSTGNYQIVFVANPDASLKASLDALEAGVSTVSDFKGTVCSQAPDSKYDSSSSSANPGLLMVSDFYGVLVKSDETTSLAQGEGGVVYLERAMARIDIVNKASGITITDVTFSNRAVKTALISDSPALNADYVEAAKTYADLKLAGDSSASDEAETNKYRAKIYSYEQYGSGDDAPSLSISYTYTIDGVTTTGTQEVKFEKSSDASGDGSAVTEQINLQRNHLYTVIVSNSAGALRFTLTVADWNSGETFEVANEWIRTGMIDYSGIAVGDVMLSDGTWVDVSALSAASGTLTDAQKAKAVGIVAYLYSSETSLARSGVRNALDGKFTTPHGLVLALKNATSDPVQWTTFSSLAANTTAHTSLADAYSQSIDGYAATQLMYKTTENRYGKYIKSEVALSIYVPAFNAARNYTQASPKSTTGWYLPSYGEWCDILSSFGGVSDASYKVSGGTAVDIDDSDGKVAKNINACLEKIGEGNYDEFSCSVYSVTTNEKGKTLYVESGGYWTTTEYDEYQVYNIIFNTGKMSYSVSKKSDCCRHVRCVLAF